MAVINEAINNCIKKKKVISDCLFNATTYITSRNFTDHEMQNVKAVLDALHIIDFCISKNYDYMSVNNMDRIVPDY